MIALWAAEVPTVRAEGPQTSQAVAPEARSVTDEGTSIFTPVTFSHSGSFRLRGDAFFGAHLLDGVGVGEMVSGVIPPVGRNASNQAPGGLVDEGDEADWLGSANMRLRWEPKLQIGEVFSIHSQLDILDNYVLGSTPVYGADDPLHPFVFLSETQSSPSAGLTNLRDAIRVKQLWARWLAFEVLTVDVGRMPHHWGMGILWNAGDCPDCDYGDSVDRMAFAFPLMAGMRFRLSWDFIGEGAILGQQFQFQGQPWDASNLDDVDQVVFDLFSRPESLQELSARRELASTPDSMAFDWGWRNVLRFEDLASDTPTEIQGNSACVSDPRLAFSFVDQPFECVVLLPREAFFWVTDLWMELNWFIQSGESLRLEAEVAGVLLSEVGQLQGLANEDSSKEFWSAGGALRTEYRLNGLATGVEVGVAMGDEQPFFGVHDRSGVVVPDDEYTDAVSRVVRENQVASRFRFNRAYHVDALLFREVIGAVTNTVYTRPSIDYRFLEAPGWSLGTRLDLLYAAAMNPEGTPGGASQLGFEVDTQLYLDVEPGLRTVLEAGVLTPFEGLDNSAAGLTAATAWTLQGRVHIAF